MKFLAVSTFNKEGFDKYGRNMINSFQRHWPDEVGLRVYKEGWELPAEMGSICLTPDLLTSSDWLSQFKARHAHRDTSDYRMDAVRFAHKVAALIAADEHCSARWLVWIDGDTFTHSPIRMSDLLDLAPKDGEWIAWLDRRKVYPECGFYIIDREHPRHGELMLALRCMYDGDLLFREKEWHDSYILQQVVERSGVRTKSLSGDVGRRTAHPFVNGPLGQWMDHMKGKRKEKGRSLRSDLVVTRRERYWR